MTNDLHPLRQAREARGFTQDDLAERCGVTKQAVSAWERGESSPQGPARMLLSAALLQPRDIVDSWFGLERATA